MKELIILLTLFNSAEDASTHWFTYYIYIETEYVQGPWARTELLSHSGYRYLAPKVFEDLFGTMKEELAEKLLERLREEKPTLYDRVHKLTLHGDTVNLEIEGIVDRRETIMNEVTATMILNSFSAVRFRYANQEETMTLADLTLPLFDLVSLSEEDSNDAGMESGQDSGKVRIGEPVASDSRNPLSHWLIVSVLFNVILILFIVFRAKK